MTSNKNGLAMNKKKIIVLILAIMVAMLIGLPLAFARGGGGGGHGGGGHASGHAGGEGHSSGGAHESTGSHSSIHEETHVVPRTYYVGHGSSYHDLCPDGVEKTEDQDASDVAVTCKEKQGSGGAVLAILLFLIAIVGAIALP